jgi:hypothetical protein
VAAIVTDCTFAKVLAGRLKVAVVPLRVMAPAKRFTEVPPATLTVAPLTDAAWLGVIVIG